MNDLLVYKLETYLRYQRSLNQMIFGILRCCRASTYSSEITLGKLNILTPVLSFSREQEKLDNLLCVLKALKTHFHIWSLKRKQQHQVVVI